MEKKLRKLTEKQQRAVVEYKTNGGNKTQAYLTAYNASNMKNATVRRNAHTLFELEHVKAHIEQHDNNIQEKFEYTIEQYIKELNEAIDFSKQLGNPASYVSAIKAKGSAFGFDKKTVVLEGDENKPLQIIVNTKK